MNEEQQAQALALCDIPDVGLCMDCGWLPYVWIGDGVRLPDLAHPSGAVEGVLHRVLEKMVGVPVEVQCVGPRLSRWRAIANKETGGGWPDDLHPTRLEAIVAALLALEVKP